MKYMINRAFGLRGVLTLLALMLAFAASAQNKITGKVVDENDAPLIGATVIVPGTSTGTGTDAAGNFSLKVDAGTQSVEISFIGYVTETREIKGGVALTSAQSS